MAPKGGYFGVGIDVLWGTEEEVYDEEKIEVDLKAFLFPKLIIGYNWILGGGFTVGVGAECGYRISKFEEEKAIIKGDLKGTHLASRLAIDYAW